MRDARSKTADRAVQAALSPRLRASAVQTPAPGP
jgi:hypothetical protein